MYEVPFGAFALVSYVLVFTVMTALASSCLAFQAKRNGGGLIDRVEGIDMWVYRCRCGVSKKLSKNVWILKKVYFAAESGESSAVDSADSTKAWADERSLAFRVFKEQCQHPFIAYPYLLNAHARCQTISD